MKVNEILIPFQVETKTDSYRVVDSQWAKDNYINEYGNVDVVFDGKYNVFRVPAFKVERDSYTDAKANYCNLYGCE